MKTESPCKMSSLKCAVMFFFMALSCTGCGNSMKETGQMAFQKSDAEPGTKTRFTAAEQADVFFSLARNAEKQQNLQEAVKMYQATLKQNPKSGEAHWRLAVCLDKSGNFQESARHYQDAVKFMPGNPEIFCDYGYSLALQNRWNESEMNLKQSIAIQPELQRAHNNLGLVLAHGSKLDEARREFQLGGLPAADAHWNLAQTLVSQSRWEEARDEFKRMKTLNPTDKQIDRQLASLNRLVTKVELARRDSKVDSALVKVSADAHRLK